MLRLMIFTLLALCTSIISAFQDTSPFFFFSTSEILLSSSQITPATSLRERLVAELQKCPSDTYVIVSQPGVNAADFYNRHSAPHMRRMISGDNKEIRSSMTVTDVIGTLDSTEFKQVAQDTCGGRLLKIDMSTNSFTINEDLRPLVINLEFPALPDQKDRLSKLAEHDSFLASIIDLIPSPKYTVLYITTPISTPLHSKPAESEPYHMEPIFQSPLHMDLKRDFHPRERSPENATSPSPNRPLFEKYQFFSPGIFVGLLVSFILLAILYVGISCIASLQVTYAAFDRDMGPAAQKQQ